MIIAYVLPLNEQNSILTRMAKNNESVTSGFNLEHTTFVTVDLEVIHSTFSNRCLIIKLEVIKKKI